MPSINRIRNRVIRGRAAVRGMMTRPMVMAAQMAVVAVTVGITAMRVTRVTKAIARRSGVHIWVADAEGCVRLRSNRKT